MVISSLLKLTSGLTNQVIKTVNKEYNDAKQVINDPTQFTEIRKLAEKAKQNNQ